MRQIFFYVLIGVLVVSGLVWGLYLVGRALLEVFNDWRLGRELDQIEAESAARRQKQKEAQERRLANGCEHDFSPDAIGLPADVCRKCGIEKVKPTGNCDHVWKVKPGAMPYSECERCGKVFKPASYSSDSGR